MSDDETKNRELHAYYRWLSDHEEPQDRLTICDVGDLGGWKSGLSLVIAAIAAWYMGGWWALLFLYAITFAFFNLLRACLAFKRTSVEKASVVGENIDPGVRS